MMIKKGRKERKIAILLYGIVLAFFTVVLFGITVSGEDILQGAGNLRNGENVSVMADLQAAFNNNGRITDMYAWSVIDFFDYQFRFGIDFIFRLMDLVMVCGIFYLMAYIVLGRRPRLVVEDALMCLVLFIAVVLTPFGRVLYAGFSAIHNYMIGAFIFLTFAILYVKKVLGKNVEEKWWKALSMFVLGIVFGMSAALTPIAFLVVVAGYLVMNWKNRKYVMWVIMGLVGVIIGVLITNIFGPGAGNYSANEVYIKTYDYVAFNELFANIPKIIVHLISNFGRVLLPLIVLSGVLLLFCDKPKQFFTKKFYKKMDKQKITLMLMGLAFVVIMILGSFQVNAPLRILFPAYLVLLIEVLVLFWPYINRAKFLNVGIVSLAGVVLIIKTVLTVGYSVQSARVFDYIKQVDGDVVCVDRKDVKSFNFPFIYLGQEDMLAEWAMPELVYGKLVSFCDGE